MRASTVQRMALAARDPNGLDWYGVPDAVRNDDAFLDLAVRAKWQDEYAASAALGEQRDKFIQERNALIAKMQARIYELTGNHG